jgi:hypothetical protein
LGGRVGRAALGQSMAGDKAGSPIRSCSGAADEGGHGSPMTGYVGLHAEASELASSPAL